MDIGGCLSCDDDFELQPLNLEPQFDAAVTPPAPNPLPSNFIPNAAPGSECCICLETIGVKNNCVTDCGHSFCFKCLAKSMARSNNCPYCRQPLSDESSDTEEHDAEEESESDISEYESERESIDDDDSSSEGEPEEPTAPAHLSYPSHSGDIEEVVRRIESLGISTLDLVSVLYSHYSKNDKKYTNEYTDNLVKMLDEIHDDVDNEHSEREQMGEEDHVSGHHRPHVCDTSCEWGCCVCLDTRPMQYEGTYRRYDSASGTWHNDAVRRANYCVNCYMTSSPGLCTLCHSWARGEY
jgi:hypothetical protein